MKIYCRACENKIDTEDNFFVISKNTYYCSSECADIQEEKDRVKDIEAAQKM
jgi:hypothetical protein